MIRQTYRDGVLVESVDDGLPDPEPTPDPLELRLASVEQALDTLILDSLGGSDV